MSTTKYTLPVMVARGNDHPLIMIDGIRYLVMTKHGTDWDNLRSSLYYKSSKVQYTSNIIVPKIYFGDIASGTRAPLAVMTPYFIQRAIKLEEQVDSRMGKAWVKFLHSADEIMKTSEFVSLPHTTIEYLRDKYQGKGTTRDSSAIGDVFVNPPIAYPKWFNIERHRELESDCARLKGINLNIQKGQE